MSDLTFTTQQLSSTKSGVPYENQDPVISGKDVYVAYNTAGSIKLDISNDGGSTFSAINLTAVGSKSETPRIAVFKGRVYLTWQQGSDIYFAFGIDGGTKFSKPIDLGTGVGPQISASGDNVIIGAATKGQTATNVWISHDAGKSFTGPQAMSAPPGKLDEVVVAVSHNNDYIAWNEILSDGDTRSYEVTSNDGGSTFRPTLDLDPGHQVSVEPLFAISKGGQVNVVLRGSDLDSHSDNEGRLIYVRSDNQGDSFSAATQIAYSIRHASVSTDGSNVDVAFLERGTTDWQVEFLHSSDYGRTFDAAVDLGDTGWANSFHPDSDDLMPSEDAENGYVNVSWKATDGVHTAISNDYGDAGSFSSSAFLGAGSSVMPAGPFTLWLDTNGDAELTSFQTSFFGASAGSTPASVAATSATASLPLVQAAAAFGTNAAVATRDSMSVTPRMGDVAILASSHGRFQAL